MNIGYPIRPTMGKVSADVMPTRIGGWGLCKGFGLMFSSLHW
jgi:hypothetical protein